MAFSASGCTPRGTGASATSSAEDTSRIVVATTGAPASLDFTTTSGAAIPAALMGNVYETLVHITDDGELEPQLATSWEISDDGTRYTFHLRDGVQFSDGTAFDAHTAKFSLDRVSTKAWTNGLKSAMAPVAETTVVDDHTLEVQLNSRSNSWLWSMGTLVGAMMHPGAVDDLARTAVGTGPYTVSNFTVGDAVEFAARSDYWGHAPGTDSAAIRYFPDAVSMSNALQAGDVDILWGLSSPELLDPLQARGEYDIDVGSSNGEILLSMNNRRAPFTDVAVRQAVASSIDRQAIIDVVWEGNGTDTGTTPAAPTDPWYAPSDRWPFDPQRAKDLLRGAGYATDGSDERLAVTITVPSLPYAQTASELIYSQLEDVGFTVTLESAEFPAAWLGQVMNGHDFDMSIISHLEPRDAPTIFGNPDYYVGYDSPQAQEHFRAADSGPASKRNDEMRAALDTVVADAASVTLLNMPSIVVSEKDIRGIAPDAVSDSLELAPLHYAQPDTEGGER